VWASSDQFPDGGALDRLSTIDNISTCRRAMTLLGCWRTMTYLGSHVRSHARRPGGHHS
jgi:hypothetical protein